MRNWTSWPCAILLLLAAAGMPRLAAGDGTPAAERTPAPARPANWAVPVTLAGAPNLHRVAAHLYRGAQPDATGLRNLEKLGVKTVINLRASADDRDEAAGTNLRCVEVKINTWRITDAEVLQVMRLLQPPENGPFLIHCRHGADRTGLICAMYRILFQNWSREAALKELRDGGYGYHAIWKNIPAYIEKANLAKLRRQLGLPASNAPAPAPAAP
ncbi:MAG: tyrosine-protein phosphatase [Lentisphaeria bacterium]|jgi:protein tyrosine/serine phosphatase